MYAARNVSTKEKELLEFCQLCLGYPVNPRIFRNILELLQANVSPASIVQMLNELAILRVQEKARRQRLLKSQQEEGIKK